MPPLTARRGLMTPAGWADRPQKECAHVVAFGMAAIMLTYFLIGAGGALGSILRAWLGAAMVALTGPTFPWGTILINIVGSFVIGFFGTLTATDGRFAAAPDLRAFVLIGVCGGFTTFSSFSLQTFDLLRDGRPGQALVNVALSVLLCLGSVAAGYAAASSLRLSSLMSTAAMGSSLANRTLIAVHRPEAVEPMLAVATQLMERQDDRMTVLAIDGPALADLAGTEELLTDKRRAELSDRRRDWVDALRPVLDNWVNRERAEGHRARWIEVRGDGARAILEHGRSAHLLLLEHRPKDAGAMERIRSALVRASRPLLLVPPGTDGQVGRVVAVAWRDDPQARQAVRNTLPILSRAERVVILHIGGEQDHELPDDAFGPLLVEKVTVPDWGHPIGDELVELARDAHADLLVMGSYDHGRALEALFDGVTESVLRAAALPVLIQPKDA